MSIIDTLPPPTARLSPVPAHTALILSALAAIFWGTNFEATRIALTGLPPWTAAFARFALAASAILTWLSLTQGLRLLPVRRNLAAFATLGVIGVAGFNAALFLGLRTSSPVTGALIMATTPISTLLIDAILQRTAPARGVVFGMGISLLGVALTVGAFAGTRLAPGDVMIFCGSLAWSFYTIGCRRWVVGATPLETSTWTMVFGALALTLAAFVFETPLRALGAAPAATLWAIAHMALIGSVLAYIFWQIGIATRGPGATAVLFNLVPVAALIVATGFGATPGISQWIGTGVAILGVSLASRPRRTP